VIGGAKIFNRKFCCYFVKNLCQKLLALYNVICEKNKENSINLNLENCTCRNYLEVIIRKRVIRSEKLVITFDNTTLVKLQKL
jgi:hypothetical protein